MKRFYLLALCLMICSCSHSSTPSIEVSPESDLTVGEQNNQFAFDFFKQIKDQSGNFFFSPYSISTAFSMTAAGAKGSTASEMWSVLHYRPDEFAAMKQLRETLTINRQLERDPELHVANALWVQKELPILPEFRKIMNKDFAAPLENTDFINNPTNAIQRINDWVRKSTNAKIDEIVTPDDVSPDTRLILTSAIYMKAQWRNLFEESLTTEESFHVSPQRTINVPMMHNTEYFRLFEGKTMTAIEMPYDYNFEDAPSLSMVLVVPTNEASLTDLENSISIEKWNKWKNAGKWRNVELSLPKFKIESEMELNPIMTQLGMREAFIPQANFSGITGKKDLYINKAVHKTFINVDEKGTEAAGATGVMMSLTSLRETEEPYQLVVDRPFLFFIVEQNTQAILFMGRVTEP